MPPPTQHYHHHPPPPYEARNPPPPRRTEHVPHPSRNDEQTPFFACCNDSHGHYGTCSREGAQSPRAIPPIKEIVVTCVLVVTVLFVVLCFLSLQLAHVRTEYNSERSAYARELLVFEHERREWDRARQEWERERREWERERMAHRPFWGEMQRVSPYCLAYNTMEYKARLWNVPLGGDWLQACMGTSQEIHGRTIEKPERCEDRGQNEGFWGYWRVDFDEPECITIWGTAWDKGCVRPGVHVVEAPMWGQKPNDDWYQMCWTTPGHLPGMSGDLGFPNDCQQRGERGGGMVGIWEFYDGNCY